MNTAVVNITRNETLHESPEWATKILQQAKGFMFSKPKQRAIIFLLMPAKPVYLHMFFVWGQIDVLALDGQGKVLALKEYFSPWTMWRPGVTASAVIELPAGTISRTNTQIGDMVSLPQFTIGK